MTRLLILLFLLATPLAAQAEMDVQRLGVSIADGGTDSATNTGTSPFNLTYTIHNDGTADLNLTGSPEVVLSGEDNCTVSVLSPPATPVAQAGSTTFILQVTPLSSASFSFEVSIDNDDADENPYDFIFSATTSSPPASNNGGSSKKDSSCSTGTTPGAVWLLLVSGVAALLLVRRKSLRSALLAD